LKEGTLNGILLFFPGRLIPEGEKGLLILRKVFLGKGIWAPHWPFKARFYPYSIKKRI